MGNASGKPQNGSAPGPSVMNRISALNPFAAAPGAAAAPNAAAAAPNAAAAAPAEIEKVSSRMGGARRHRHRKTQRRNRSRSARKLRH